LHYVNIALGTVFPGVAFCLSARAALAGFVLPLKIHPHKNKSRHVLQQGGRKKHDRKTGQKGWLRGGLSSMRIYVGKYVTYYVDKKLKLWHLEK